MSTTSGGSASLRARLWASYAVLITGSLALVAVVLFVQFFRNPRLLYPEVVYRMRLTVETIADRLNAVEQLSDLTTTSDYPRLQKELAKRGYWVALVTRPQERQVLVSPGSDPPAARMILAVQRGQVAEAQARVVRTRESGAWIYTWQAVDARRYLIIAAAVPALPFSVLLRNDFFSAFIVAGGVGLVLSFLLALWLGGSITNPLRRMVAASQAVARGENPSVPVEGPLEVRELAQAMNEMSQRVQATQQSQRDFVANVSHELKTPLTSIQGFAQAILDGAAQTPEALQQSAGVIYSEAARMHRLVLDLLSLARLEAGTADLQREPVHLPALLHAVVERLTPQARQAQVMLSVQAAEDAPAMIGDGDRLAQVFNNLVDNAIKFTPPGGQVLLALRVEPGALLVTVHDSGKGISAEDQARIFERFYQVDRSRRGGIARGVGLGLPIARQIVLAHGGQIWVESQAGQGSRFVVKIPLKHSMDASPASQPKGKR